MTTIRIGRRRRYTQIDRDTVRDVEISYRALGVLAWLLDKPDDWQTNADQIGAARPKGEGRNAVRTALKELEEAGYLSMRTWRDEGGRYQSEWTVSERPNATEPDRISGAGDPSPFTAADSRAAIENPVTKDCPSQKLRSRADPNCVRCRGEGRIWNAGAGANAPCPCTTARPLVAVQS